MDTRNTHNAPKIPIGSWGLNALVFLLSAALVVVIIRWKNQQHRTQVPAGGALPTVRVQVLNGCGVSGVAGVLREYLMRYQVDIRETGNTRLGMPETVVMDRVGDRKKAEAVARLIGVDENHVIQQINKSLIDIDVTVIIGKDYRARFKGILPLE
jgi:hypothetical protein